MTFKHEDLSWDSGLFVASKYPLESARFIPFKVEGMQQGINKGYFSADMQLSADKMLRVYIAHLNPFNDETAERVRGEEVQAVIDDVELQARQPTMFFGDMNMPYGTEEWRKSRMRSFFVMNYPEMANTCTDYLDYLVKTPVDERKSVDQVDQALVGVILDYFLMCHHKEDVEFKTSMIKFYDLQARDYRQPGQQAFSDHQGLLTEVKVLR